MCVNAKRSPPAIGVRSPAATPPRNARSTSSADCSASSTVDAGSTPDRAPTRLQDRPRERVDLREAVIEDRAQAVGQARTLRDRARLAFAYAEQLVDEEGISLGHAEDALDLVLTRRRISSGQRGAHPRDDVLTHQWPQLHRLALARDLREDRARASPSRASTSRYVPTTKSRAARRSRTSSCSSRAKARPRRGGHPAR